MGRKHVRKHKPPQAAAKPVSKDNAGVGVSSAGEVDGSFPGEHRDANRQIPNEQPQSPGEARSEAASLKEQFYTNDSLGG